MNNPNEQNDEMLIKLQHFFESDMRIKKEMYNMAPPHDSQVIDIERYTDSVNDSLIYIFSELKCVALDLFGKDSQVLQTIKDLEKKTKNEFYSCGYDINKLRNFYKNNISNMSVEFLNAVKLNCIGYTFNGLPVDKVSTANEALHLMHASVMNNDHLLQSIPAIDTKENDFKYPITLRGADVPSFKYLFNAFPNDIAVGWPDIVALDERKLLMMVRDRGHALTIEITLNGDNGRVEYFIPKICNIDMVNALEGVNKINSYDIGTTGVFERPLAELPDALYTFISKVPMDMDLPSVSWQQ